MRPGTTHKGFRAAAFRPGGLYQTVGVDHMKVQPLHDRILVQRLEKSEQKIGGIIIPNSAKERQHQGKVTAVGIGM